MAPRYQHSHSIDAILECPDEGPDEVRGTAHTLISDNKKRRDGDNPSTTTSTTTTTMASTRAKDKPKRSHRSSFSTRHTTKSKPKANSAKRYSAHDESQTLVRQHPRHTQRDAHSDSSSSSSEEDEGDKKEDHHAILAAARSRLTSPSLVSTLTSLTTATNNSSSSSGSNSTVTQASMSRPTAHEVTISGTTEEVDEGPMSPGTYPSDLPASILTNAAAPDPPNVFAYLDEDDSSSSDEEKEDEEDDDEDEDEDEHFAPHAPEPVPEAPHLDEDAHDYDNHEYDEHSSPSSDIHPQTAWLHPLSPTSADDATPHAPTFHARTPSLSSSASSVISDTSSHPFDADTDRSTSPEQSIKGSPPPTQRPRLVLPRPPSSPPLSSPTEAKLAAQMRAAHQRQNLHSPPYNQHHHRRHNHNQHQHQHHPPPLALHPPPSHAGTQALSPRHPGPNPMHSPHSSLPPSGYEALAARLTTSPPIYRRFASLNHRLLLHMQDELCELEDHLAALDAADAASRTLALPPSPSSSPSATNNNNNNNHSAQRTKTTTHPFSRRLSNLHATPLNHHRIDLLNRLSLKMSQYNTTLSSFSQTSQLPAAIAEDVQLYRQFLHETRPLVDAETKFLDAEGDLVSLVPSSPPPQQEQKSNDVLATMTTTSSSTAPATPQPQPQQLLQHQPRQRSLLLAALSSILIPVLMFTVVPNFVGRIAVSLLVAGMLWGMVVGSGDSGGGAGLRIAGGAEGWGLVWGWGAGILVAAVVV